MGRRGVPEATAALGLFRGSDLIVEGVNDELRALSGCDQPIGMPAREVWIGDIARSVIATMSEVFRDGATRHCWVIWLGNPGSVLIVPVYRKAALWGVATSWEPLPATVHPPTSEGFAPGLGAIPLGMLLAAPRTSERVA